MVKKNIVLLLVLILAVTLFTACDQKTSSPTEATTTAKGASSTEGTTADKGTAGNTPETSKDLDILWVHSGAANQSEQRAYAGFMAYIKQMGWNWKITEVNSEDQDAKSANHISDGVAKGYDVIIASMVDMRATVPAIKEANAANIPIFSIDCGYTEGVVVDVTSNNNVMSAKVSTYLTDVLGGQGNICVLSASGFAGGRKRGNVLYAVLEECPGIKVLDDHNIDLTDFFNDSANATEDWVARFGDQIDAIWCVWDEPAMAATNVLTAAGYTRDDLVIVSIDGNEAAVQMMRDGSPIIATVAQPFEVMGSTTAKFIQNHVVKGQSWDEAIGATTFYVDAPLITTTNIPPKGTPAYQAVDFYSTY